ncbi:MAG: hypothetical protein ACRDHY_06930 [Anaerolineales bacterium]
MVLRVQDRIENARRTVRREVGILRDVVEDVRERVDADTQVEPPHTRGRGGLLGQRGSLVKTPVAVVLDTGDNILEHVQGFARINRSMLR